MAKIGDGFDDDYGQEAVDELQSVHSTLSDASSTLEEIQSTLDDIRSIIKDRGNHPLLWILFLVALFGNWPGSKLDRFTDRVWYSVGYNTDWKNVDIQRRPTDCDIFHAPIGMKGCSYSKDKIIFDDADRRKLLAQAQTPEERNEINQRPNTIAVYWAKKDEP
jgi:hypothetical protein